jgi:small subunit ribosomal protein S27e
MSRFLRVKCECGSEQNVFGNATLEVKCGHCKKTLATPTGGRVKILGKVLKVL